MIKIHIFENLKYNSMLENIHKNDKTKKPFKNAVF